MTLKRKEKEYNYQKKITGNNFRNEKYRANDKWMMYELLMINIKLLRFIKVHTLRISVTFGYSKTAWYNNTENVYMTCLNNPIAN